MPCGWIDTTYIPKTWKTMKRWERKNWYRDNQFKPLAKKP